MSLVKYVERLQRMDSLISRRATGSPDEFAKKMNLRRSTLFQHLQEMKEMGAAIRYSYIRQTYYYVDGSRILISVEKGDKEKNKEKK